MPEHNFYRAVTQAELAKIFDTHSTAMSRYVKAGMPYEIQAKKKVFDVKVVFDWMLEREMKKYEDSKKRPIGDEDNMIFEDNLDRARYFQAEKAKLQVERERGKLILREDHEDFVRQAGDYVRQGFQTMPKKLAVKLAKLKDTNEIEKLLDDEVIGTLKRLSEIELEISDDGDD
jgi:phage terminase Nu1 subunit (DNA packaging protein)